MWKIGEIEIENKVVVAPMAGVTNSAFRTITKEFGAGLVVCEMISDNALLSGSNRTKNMLHIEPSEYPLSIQIMGGDPESMVKAAQYIQEHTEAAIIDINMGCPVPKITKNDAGSKILLDSDHIFRLVSNVVKAIDLPVTVKMRTGWDEEHLWPVENALAAESAGAKMIAMHGRTRMQMYEGKADWSILKEVKDSLQIPFVANGDIRTPADIEEVLKITGADAAMIGRAALGNPWIVRQLKHYLETGEVLSEPGPIEKVETAKVHMLRLIGLRGADVAAREFRKHAAYYLKGFPRAAKVKMEINQQTDPYKTIEIMETFAKKAEIKWKEKSNKNRRRIQKVNKLSEIGVGDR